MKFDTGGYLSRATARAKSDVANKLVSMFLHELSRRISARLGVVINSEAYTQAVVSRFGDSCAYCMRSLESDRAAVEHLDGMNRYRVGLHIVGNVVVACKRCNGEKRRDDSLRALRLATTGWQSFLAHNKGNCPPTCKTCAYWASIWPLEPDRIARLTLVEKRIREFRAEFPNAIDYYERVRNVLPPILDRLYRDCQSFATERINEAIESSLLLIKPN